MDPHAKVQGHIPMNQLQSHNDSGDYLPDGEMGVDPSTKYGESEITESYTGKTEEEETYVSKSHTYGHTYQKKFKTHTQISKFLVKLYDSRGKKQYYDDEETYQSRRNRDYSATRSDRTYDSRTYQSRDKTYDERTYDRSRSRTYESRTQRTYDSRSRSRTYRSETEPSDQYDNTKELRDQRSQTASTIRSRDRRDHFWISSKIDNFYLKFENFLEIFFITRVMLLRCLKTVTLETFL